MEHETFLSALKEDIQDMKQELPMFLWSMTPWVVGLFVILAAQQYIQQLLGV